MMQDNNVNKSPVPADADDNAAGEVGRRGRLDIGSRATILMGLTMGAMAAAAAFLPGYGSFTVSKV
jgi:hypothetical protein